jgi:thiosulfate reductase cytochrome b subunit
LCYPRPVLTATTPPRTLIVRHTGLVRVTHWITVLAFLALLVTGAEIVLSHPRFYWGEIGNVNVRPLFTLPVPSSRDTVPTKYKYVLPDQNGWSRYLHFEAAWVLVLTGAIYGVAGIWSGHFRRNLFPGPDIRTPRAYLREIGRNLRPVRPDADQAASYNILQRTAYLAVIFVLFPLVIGTGLALSPSFNSAVPWAVDLLGGRQSARTLHFFFSWALVLFLVIHLTMIALSGFWGRTRAMITGRVVASKVRP